MLKNLKNPLKKIFLLTSWIVLISLVSMDLLSAFLWVSNNETEKTNENTFQNTQNIVLWKTGVALTTNMWTRFKQREEIPVTIYNEVLSLSQLMWSSWIKSGSWFISQNMVVTQEYRNVLKTNIKWLLDQTNDKAQMLDAIIGQLEYRYNLAVEQMKALLSQRTVLENEMSSADSQVESLKNKINSDFQKNDATASYENIEKYLELKNRYYYARTYAIYINQFLADYNALNEYNKKLLDTLINNKTALIKDAYVVIPDTWVEFLRDFNLLYNESEYKATQKSQ